MSFYVDNEELHLAQYNNPCQASPQYRYFSIPFTRFRLLHSSLQIKYLLVDLPNSDWHISVK